MNLNWRSKLIWSVIQTLDYLCNHIMNGIMVFPCPAFQPSFQTTMIKSHRPHRNCTLFGIHLQACSGGIMSALRVSCMSKIPVKFSNFQLISSLTNQLNTTMRWFYTTQGLYLHESQMLTLWETPESLNSFRPIPGNHLWLESKNDWSQTIL